MLEKKIKTISEALEFPKNPVYKEIKQFVEKIVRKCKSQNLTKNIYQNKIFKELDGYFEYLKIGAVAMDKKEEHPEEKRFGNTRFRNWVDETKVDMIAFHNRILKEPIFSFDKIPIQKEGYFFYSYKDSFEPPKKEDSIPGSGFSLENLSLEPVKAVDQKLVSLPITKKVLVSELSEYLIDSFGERSRIDYGTGHELSFLIYLFIFYRLGVFDVENEIKEFLNLFRSYLDLARTVQAQFRLEPAGSKGVWGIDDYQYLPLLFGASQLIGKELVEPARFPFVNPKLYSDENLFFGVLRFIEEMKTGKLEHNSPILFGLHRFRSWEEVTSYLLRHYEIEVMSPFPVAQHIKFGRLFPYNLEELVSKNLKN